MKYGYFDDINREYVITDPATPLPWINYLGCRDFFSLISNTCGGYWGWNTGDAYYEIARLDDENDQESMHALLLKTDYATAQQTVLCNVPGCTHDNAACPAWLEDWARTDVLVMPSGIYLSYAGLDDTSPWEQVEKACRDDFEQGNVKNFADEEAYIDYCRHNLSLIHI